MSLQFNLEIAHVVCRELRFPPRSRDPGVEANEFLKIYLVSSKEEVDSEDSFVFEPVDLTPFFGDDGKIYGYKNLKVTVWISSISFHVYADIAFESSSDGGKGITDLKSALMGVLQPSKLVPLGGTLLEQPFSIAAMFLSHSSCLCKMSFCGTTSQFCAGAVLL